MSARKQDNRIEAIRDAAAGYAAVVLGIACFLLVLVLVVAGVRIIVGAGLAASSTTATATAVGATPSASVGAYPNETQGLPSTTSAGIVAHAAMRSSEVA